MFAPLSRAVAQLGDPVLRGVVWRSAALSALALALLAAGLAVGLERLVPAGWAQSWWLGWVANAAGVVGTALLAVWLFVPLAVLVASLFLERVAAAVERRWYPELPPARGGAPLAAQLWDGLALGARVLVLQLAALLLAVLLPGVGLVLGLIATGWGLGRGLFVGVAMRRIGREAANALYGQRRLLVVLQGVALALAGTVPLANLLIPVLGTATMVHVLHRRAQQPPA